MGKNISEITRTLTNFDGTERGTGYDVSGSSNFKMTGMFDTKEQSATGFKNYIIDGDFNHWNNGTSFSQADFTEGYTSDMWYMRFRTTTATLTREINIDSDVESYFARIDVTANAAQYVQIEQRIKDISLLADKNISIFLKIKSNTGLTNLRVYVDRFDGTDQNLTFDDIGVIPSNDTWTWYRIDLVIPDLSGVGAISANNYTRLLIQNVSSELFRLDIDKVRVIETPSNLAAGEIPEWVKADEDPEYTKQLTHKYYNQIFGYFLEPMAYGRGYSADACDFSIPINTEMVQTPTVTLNNIATNHYSNITTGTGINLSGSETISNIGFSPGAVDFRLTDTGKFAVHDLYYLFVRDSTTRSIILDARY
jgi:hypothetical protein